VGRSLLVERLFINTVGHHGSEQTISRYIESQGLPPEDYEGLLHTATQPFLMGFQFRLSATAKDD
jgi:hypothetical protein